MKLPPPSLHATLSPYTTLFRSAPQAAGHHIAMLLEELPVVLQPRPQQPRRIRQLAFHLGQQRSEEHTSELQSHLNLVCRLLLEKNKYSRFANHHALPRKQISLP